MPSLPASLRRTIGPFALAGALILPAAVPDGQAAAPRVLRMEARDFAFFPSSFAVDVGDHVTIELTSSDTVHGLHLEGYDVSLTADPGRPARVSFRADRPGVYRMRCSIPCGPLHPFMAARLRVGPPRPFAFGLALLALAVIAGGFALYRRPPAGSSP